MERARWRKTVRDDWTAAALIVNVEPQTCYNTKNFGRIEKRCKNYHVGLVSPASDLKLDYLLPALQSVQPQDI